MTQRWTPGQLIGERYRVDRFLAEGGSGEVYAAQNVWTGRLVAVKRLLPGLHTDATIVERFVTEGRIGGRIEHPNIVQVLDMGREPTDESLFIVQELLRGESLRAVITHRCQLRIDEAMDLAIPILGALVAVHQQGIVHRDVKPENIFVLEAPFGQRIPKLLDFGIAKVSQEHTITQEGSVMGTLGYMPPEQLEGSGEVDRRADVWAVGIVLYEMLAGAHPFFADTYVAAMHKILYREARPLHDVVPHCPRGVSDIVHRTLRKNRQDRPDSMLSLLEEILRWSREEPDEFLRSLVSRHRMSIPSLLEQRLLGGEDGGPGASRAHGSTNRWQAMPLSIHTSRRFQIPSVRPETAAEFDVDFDLESLLTPIPEEVDDDSLVATGRQARFDPAVQGAAPAGREAGRMSASRDAAARAPTLLGQPAAPQAPLERAGIAGVDAPDDEEEGGASSRINRLDSYATSAAEALARNDFVAACGAANLVASTVGKNAETRAAMRLLQARAYFWLGDATSHEAHAFAAFRLATAGSALRLQAAAELASATSTLGILDTLLELVDEIVQANVSDPVLPDYLIACCRLGIALQRAGWPEHVERVLGRVQADLVSWSEANAEVRAWTLLLRAELADHAGDPARSLDLTREARLAFMECGDRRWACVCRGNAGSATLALGGYEEARAELGLAIHEATSSNLAQSAIMQLNLGLAEARDGELRSAVGNLRSSLQSLSDSTDWRVLSAGHRYLAEALALSGRTEEAEMEARMAIDLAEPSPALRAQALSILALVLLATPRIMEAFMSASQAMEMLVSLGGVAEDEARIRLVYAMSLDAMGHARSARDAYDGARRRLLARANRISDPSWRESFLQRVPDHQRTLALAAARCVDE